jgi:hypothetical protein
MPDSERVIEEIAAIVNDPAIAYVAKQREAIARIREIVAAVEEDGANA